MLFTKTSVNLIACLLLCCACSDPVEYPVAIEDVRMEAGLQTDQFIFYARFVNDKGKLIPTEGELEIQLLQNEREFFKTTIKVELEDFVPYGMGTNKQFQSKPISTSQFSFQPRFNKVGWYDHTLKSVFRSGEGRPVLTWNGGYSFEKLFQRSEKTPEKL